MSSVIKLLDEMTINKIAAGEIIEKPASVVKELVENSIDANSNHIIVEVKNGGKDYIRVTDNGEGIKSNQIELAFLRHSTSKISNIEDLNSIYSLGFRGEALASIGMVSKVELLTRTEDSLKGLKVLLKEGVVENKELVGCPIGTSMIIKDLFYNVPVRQKFLKSDIVEGNLISDVVYKLALGNPKASFKYIKDNKTILKTPGSGELSSNIYSILGKDFVDNLEYFTYTNSNISIKGFLSNNTFHRGNRKHQYIYVNNRWVKNDEITKTIESCYKTLIPINKYPVFIIYIDIKPSIIDINIHPTKEEIKFANQDEINSLIRKITYNKINKIVTIPNVEITKIDAKDEQIDFLDSPNSKTDIKIQDDVKKYENDYKNNEPNVVYEKIIDEPNTSYNVYKDSANSIDEHLKISDVINDANFVGILFNTYIILENRKFNEFYIIDQHAAHERIMYEKFMEEYKNEMVIVQRLFTPYIIELSGSEMDIVINNIELFKRLGFELEEFGINTIMIRGVPLVFGKPSLKELFLNILDNIRNELNSNYDINIAKIAKLACSQAIKGGDVISQIEVKGLLNQLQKVQNPYTCPHGRPVIIKMSKRELEKEFKRVM